jgi:Uma2 family endonuclease
MPAALDRYYTRGEVLAFPDDGNRYELVHGELLMSPAPRRNHQRVVFKLAKLLSEYVSLQGLGEVLLSPADISFGRRVDVLVQPDVFVVGSEYPRDQEWEAIRSLSLVAEVLSPATARFDRFTKRRLYQEMQVPLYWIIDSETSRAEVWTPDATTPIFESERLSWQPAGAAAPLVVGLAELLEP